MMSAHVLQLNTKLYYTLLKVMFNQRKPWFNQAMHVLLMHSFFVVDFLFFFFSLIFRIRILDSLHN